MSERGGQSNLPAPSAGSLVVSRSPCITCPFDSNGFTGAMRFLKPLIAGVLLVSVAPLAAAQAAPIAASAPSAATSSSHGKVAFGAGPATRGKLDGRPYFTYDAQAGGVLVDHIAIVNFATRAQTLNVYTVDAATGGNGNFVYAARSVTPKQVGAWLSVTTPKNSGELTVGPRATVILALHLHVPANASPGDHAGAVIVSLTSLVKGKGKQRVKFEQRIATRVIIRVSGALHPGLSIVNLRAHYAGHLSPFSSGTVDVTYTVKNNGNVLLGAAQALTVHGLFGSSARAVTMKGVPLLLPGGAYQVSAQVPGVFPEISITATVKLGPEGLRGDVNPALKPVSASVHLWAVPWLLVLIVLIVLVVTGLLIWRRRRRNIAPVRARADKAAQGVTP